MFAASICFNGNAAMDENKMHILAGFVLRSQMHANVRFDTDESMFRY